MQNIFFTKKNYNNDVNLQTEFELVGVIVKLFTSVVVVVLLFKHFIHILHLEKNK